MNTPITIVAEAGVNHNGQRELALELIDAAASAGADAVKFQTFEAQKLASAMAPKAAYQKQTAAEESQLAMLQKLELPRAWHVDLQLYAKKKNIQFLSTAFDVGSLHFLQTLDLPLYKIPSGEITNGPLLWQFARTGKPIILSTGMSTTSEIRDALAVIYHGLHHDVEPTSMQDVRTTFERENGLASLKNRVTLLHCTSQYPAPVDEVNLRAMDTLETTFGLPVGYSDHTSGITVAIAAAARGASVIEKHFTIDNRLPGPDHKASLTPDELAEMVTAIRDVTQALGDGIKAPQRSELDTIKAARQQLVAASDIKSGHILTRGDLATARSGDGISPLMLWELVGRTTKQSYRAGDIIKESLSS